MEIKILSLVIALLFSLGITGCANEGEYNMSDYSVIYDETESSSETSENTGTDTSTASESESTDVQTSAETIETSISEKAESEASTESQFKNTNTQTSAEQPGVATETTTDTKLQTATYTVKGVDFKMILVEAGTFTMGSDNTDTAFNESPAHTVTLTKDYLMGETEVTETLWNAVMENGGGSNTHPKTSITWSEAHTFAEKLTELAREQGLIGENQSFCLPTETQWEFAAKGGNLSKGYLYSGSNDIDEVAVTYENSSSNAPLDVKTKAPNELGLYDMSGNAYEWVDDYGGDYSSEAQTDPQNTNGSGYVKRSGSNYHSFSSESYLFTTTGRYFYSSTDWTIGLRIALVEE